MMKKTRHNVLAVVRLMSVWPTSRRAISSRLGVWLSVEIVMLENEVDKRVVGLGNQGE